MVSLSRLEFEALINTAIEALPERYVEHLANVAFIIEDQPNAEQRQRLHLRGDQSLFGLYEGVPLSARQGTVKLLPDKITIFQKPLEAASQTPAELRERVGRTVWHEVAHYYGLDHTRINELEQKENEP